MIDVLLNLVLYLIAMGAILTIFLPFSPMTIDLILVSRERLIAIYRNRHILWIIGALAFGLLLVRSALAEWLPDTAVAQAIGGGGALWFWVAAGSVGALAVAFWSGYVPYVMTPPSKVEILSPAEADRSLSPDDTVLGLLHGGQARAYPRDQLSRPHYVKDTVAGTPLTISYCILCNSGIAFKSELGGRPLDLMSVTAYNNNIIFLDPERGNFLQQLDGRIIDGPDKGKQLESLPLLVSSWREWKQLHPDTKVYFAPPTGLRDRMVDMMLQMMIPIDKLARRDEPWHRVKGSLDTRLPAMSFVFGVELGGERCAYPVSGLEREAVVNDTLGGEPLTVFYDERHKLGSVFSRRQGGRDLTFRRAAGEAGAALAKDDETGSEWDVHGHAVSGELAGAQLTEIPHFNKLFWFSWALFKPGTRIASVDAPQTEPSRAAVVSP